VTGKEIIDSSRMAQLHNYILDKVSSGKVLNASTSFILFDDLETYNRALAAFILAFGETRVTELGGQILEIKGGREEIGRIGFGLSARIVESLQQAGFAVIPQLVSSPRESEVELLNKIRKIQQFKNIKTILFSGKEVPGHRGGMDVVISQMKDLKLNFGFLEFTPQAGAARLAEHLPERTIIVHMITNARMNQLDPDQVANQFVRAVLERGARILYLRPYLNSEEHESLLVDNRTYLVNLKSRLENLGFRLSPIDVPVMTNLRHISFIEILMITLAMSMLLVLVVEKVYVLDIKYVQYLIAGVVIFNILAFFSGHLLATRRLFALMTAVVTPFWAMVQSFPLEETLATTKTEFKTRFQEVIKNSLKMIAHTAVGILLIVGLLSDPYYMQKIYTFSGVKIAFVLPILMIALFSFFYPLKIKYWRYLIKKLINTPITYGGLAFVSVLMVGFALYILRSGNSISFAPDGALRDLLSQLFVVRPRTKEFLIGYPAFILAGLFYGTVFHKARLWAWLSVAIIAPISLMNSFAHIHSPLFLSIVRSFNGWLLGVLVAVILFFVYHLIQRLWKLLVY
jgi:hypothetical protein